MFDDQKELYSTMGDADDYLQFGCHESKCYLKNNDNSGDLSSFESCNYNDRFDIDKCVRCQPDAPYSFGFGDEMCHECSSMVDVISQSPPIE